MVPPCGLGVPPPPHPLGGSERGSVESALVAGATLPVAFGVANAKPPWLGVSALFDLEPKCASASKQRLLPIVGPLPRFAAALRWQSAGVPGVVASTIRPLFRGAPRKAAGYRPRKCRLKSCEFAPKFDKMCHRAQVMRIVPRRARCCGPAASLLAKH
jgi:hypothetical protein